MNQMCASQPIELWGGVECTHNRVGDEFFDQLEQSGHTERIADLDLFAALGLRAMRYPVLWERTAPGRLDDADWSWSDQRLARLRTLGMRPIVGLVHHGSGPRHTSLIDPGFAEGLAAFAGAVARRYPWVEDYTPINEPLTTARFSGLYGHWYPHGRDELTFFRALLNQCRAVVLSMRAIRAINPQARLVQTEDLGKTWSTPLLAHQANFENERRWLSFDLLCGRVDRTHPLWKHLRAAGISEAELDWFRDQPCPPDVIGLNYYLSSERFLDEELRYYPAHTHGGNGQQRYADVEAVRARAAGLGGAQALFADAWQRYRLPLAVTEAHNGCTREEQVRWLAEIWQAAHALAQSGVDIRAVTAWSLLGAYDWQTLVTRKTGFYEPGIFDLRAPQPRPTLLARFVRTAASGAQFSHPLLDAPGWWRRPERLLYQCMIDDSGQRLPPPVSQPRCDVPLTSARPILITGATGTLGQAFARICELRGLPYRLLTRQQLDIVQPASIDAALNELQPWVVVNAAGYVHVDQAEHEPDRCYRENTDGPALLAAICAARGIALLTFSSDLVFDGAQQTPYTESASVAPLNVYGRSKSRAEACVLAALPSALVIRTSAFFGPWDSYNFVTQSVRALAADQTISAADDTLISPTYVPDLVHACLDLLLDGADGIWHLANAGAISWADLARQAAQRIGLDAGRVLGCPTSTLGLRARRPQFSVLGSQRGTLLPALENALDRYVHEAQPIARSAALGR